jgi:hypothetical protein
MFLFNANVRVSELSIIFGQSFLAVLQVNLPMRFIFILLTPANDFNMDCHEIGRSFSTLMSNPVGQAKAST